MQYVLAASEEDFWGAYPDIISTYLNLEDAASDANVAALVTLMKANNSCAGLANAGAEHWGLKSHAEPIESANEHPFKIHESMTSY